MLQVSSLQSIDPMQATRGLTNLPVPGIKFETHQSHVTVKLHSLKTK